MARTATIEKGATKVEPPKTVDPKMGARAGRRVADLEKAHGKRKTKEIVAAAREVAIKKNDRVLRLEYLFEAEGVKMPAHAKTHYANKNAVVGSFDPSAPPKARSGGQGNGGAAVKSKSAGKSTGKGTAAPKSGSKTGRGSSASSSSSSAKKDDGKKTSNADNLRALREKQAEEIEAGKAAVSADPQAGTEQTDAPKEEPQTEEPAEEKEESEKEVPSSLA